MVRTLTAVVLVAGLLLVGGGVSAREAALSTDTPTGLSEAEALDLQYLRDEEKLARDVYLYFAAIYNKPIFSDIAASEQQHMPKFAGCGHILVQYRKFYHAISC